MADLLCSVDDLMKRDVGQLRNLCKSYGLPTLGAKFILAGRISQYMVNQSQSSQIKRDSDDSNMIGKLSEQLARLDAKIDARLSVTDKKAENSEISISTKLEQVEQDIDILYNRYIGMQVEHSTPA